MESKIGVSRRFCAQSLAANFWKLDANIWSVCSGGRLHHEESFLRSEVSTVWLLASRERGNAQTYVLPGLSFIPFAKNKIHAL